MIEGFQLKLAGGSVGATAASNEEAYDNTLVIAPFVLALIFVFTLRLDRSAHARARVLASKGFATVLICACIGIIGMDLNVDTVPMIAVGIGLGLDCAIYMMDCINEELHCAERLHGAGKCAVGTTGVAVAFTASMLIGGIVI